MKNKARFLDNCAGLWPLALIVGVLLTAALPSLSWIIIPLWAAPFIIVAFMDHPAS